MDGKKGIILIITLMVAVIAASGCTDNTAPGANTTTSGYPVNVTDSYDRVTTIDSQPERIISLSPSNTEILFALGLGDRVVGNTDFCYYPEEAKNKTKVGGLTTVNVEQVIALNPDVIFAASLTGKDVVENLDSMGYKVIANDPRNATDIDSIITMMGEVTGAEDNATKLMNDLDSRISAVTSKVSGIKEEDKPNVLLVIWHDPVYVAGSNCYGDDLIKLAGGRNAGAEVTDYGVMSTEAIIQADPDIIIVTVGEGGTASYDYFKNATQPWMSDLKAVKNGKVYGLDSDTISRPGPRIANATEAMAKVIHPELFE